MAKDNLLSGASSLAIAQPAGLADPGKALPDKLLERTKMIRDAYMFGQREGGAGQTRPVPGAARLILETQELQQFSPEERERLRAPWTSDWERYHLINNKIIEHRTRADELDNQVKVVEGLQAKLIRFTEAVEEMERWARGEMRIERAGETLYADLVHAIRRRHALFLRESWFKDEAAKKNARQWETKALLLAEESNLFLVEHNWAAAFAHAEGLREGEFSLPYPGCLFEFQISGRRLFYYLNEQPGGRRDGTVFIKGPMGWVMVGIECINAETGDKRHSPCIFPISTALDQIRAACIMLEAKVAVHEPARMPLPPDYEHEAGAPRPLPGYRVVRLAHRYRVAPAPSTLPSDRRRPRCHFRRSHDRHYAGWVTRIPWTLAGDPDLGFVDHEYRL